MWKQRFWEHLLTACFFFFFFFPKKGEGGSPFRLWVERAGRKGHLAFRQGNRTTYLGKPGDNVSNEIDSKILSM